MLPFHEAINAPSDPYPQLIQELSSCQQRRTQDASLASISYTSLCQDLMPRSLFQYSNFMFAAFRTNVLKANQSPLPSHCICLICGKTPCVRDRSCPSSADMQFSRGSILDNVSNIAGNFSMPGVRPSSFFRCWTREAN